MKATAILKGLHSQKFPEIKQKKKKQQHFNSVKTAYQVAKELLKFMSFNVHFSIETIDNEWIARVYKMGFRAISNRTVTMRFIHGHDYHLLWNC